MISGLFSIFKQLMSSGINRSKLLVPKKPSSASESSVESVVTASVIRLMSPLLKSAMSCLHLPVLNFPPKSMISWSFLIWFSESLMNLPEF